MKKITNSLDFSVDYDVVVAGAGMAGVAAALASARAGKKTALVEKTIMNGGLATIGSVLYYLPISDIRHNQVTFGIAEELLLASIKYGPGDVPDWKNKENTRYGVAFNPMSFVLAMDELLDNAGVALWYDTLLCGVEQEEDGTVTGIVVENKSGRGIIHAHSFVDATGDADIAWRGGAPTQDGENFLSIWGVGYSMEAAAKAVKDNDGTPLCQLIGWGSSDTGNGHPEGMPTFMGINGKDVSRFVVESRRLALNAYKDLHAKNGRTSAFPAMLPTMPDYRMSRHIVGDYTLQTGEEFTQFDDSVGIVADWRGGKDLWSLPYRALTTKALPGVLTAGRCLGAHGQAWHVFRVIQAAAMSGEVAGLAAAMSADRNVMPDALNVTDLQNELKKRSFLLDMRELGNLEVDVKVANR